MSNEQSGVLPDIQKVKRDQPTTRSIFATVPKLSPALSTFDLLSATTTSDGGTYVDSFHGIVNTNPTSGGLFSTDTHQSFDESLQNHIFLPSLRSRPKQLQHISSIPTIDSSDSPSPHSPDGIFSSSSPSLVAPRFPTLSPKEHFQEGSQDIEKNSPNHSDLLLNSSFPHLLSHSEVFQSPATSRNDLLFSSDTLLAITNSPSSSSHQISTQSLPKSNSSLQPTTIVPTKPTNPPSTAHSHPHSFPTLQRPSSSLNIAPLFPKIKQKPVPLIPLVTPTFNPSFIPQPLPPPTRRSSPSTPKSFLPTPRFFPSFSPSSPRKHIETKEKGSIILPLHNFWMSDGALLPTRGDNVHFQFAHKAIVVQIRVIPPNHQLTTNDVLPVYRYRITAPNIKSLTIHEVDNNHEKRIRDFFFDSKKKQKTKLQPTSESTNDFDPLFDSSASPISLSENSVLYDLFIETKSQPPLQLATPQEKKNWKWDKADIIASYPERTVKQKMVVRISSLAEEFSTMIAQFKRKLGKIGRKIVFGTAESEGTSEDDD
ncbi:hypothetical protein BLNAU_16773 [Blattamonas nauphoetae]|uniref:Uncharacterized protein n=1 Tax=Blattamonas nauphoetae TaxID=2049346 RepID=A0ABQ9XBT0_9EUKA|nr:hypothetical protein BLNAU_16773 [Blattamonas nauphoetae]